VDLEITTGRLNQVVEYAPADQVVTVECGVTLAQLQGELGKNGQRLALDPPQPEKATLGGIVAANSFGPLRTRYGSVRDLIIGVSILRADGTRAKGGGKVVKTVAGFDLPKLMCGSYGTLAFIATATFRVHPLPEKTVRLRARGGDPLEMVRRVRALQLEPVAMIALGEGAGWDVFIRFEGFGAGVRAQREKLRELEEAEWPGHAEGAVRLRFGALPTQAAQVAKAPAVVAHFDRCLGCMACVTACPSGVRYDVLIEETRAYVERKYRRRLWDRLHRWMIFQVFPYPRRLRAMAAFLLVYVWTG